MDAKLSAYERELQKSLQGFKKVLVIKFDNPGAGLGAFILNVLNILRYCERHTFYPVVDFDASCTNAYYDERKGSNMWHQYFKSVMPVSSIELRQWIAADHQVLAGIEIKTMSYDEARSIYEHGEDNIRVYHQGTYRFSKIPKDLDAWYWNERSKGRAVVAKYIKPNEEIQTKVDAYCQAYFAGSFVLGIHIRGTDMHYAPPLSPAEYFEHIDRMLEGKRDAKIFVATDQAQYLEVFSRKYGARVIYSPAFRSDNDVAPFNREEISPFKKGEDVMLDMLLLSRCDFLIKGVSSVGEIALYFNPELDCLDLAYQKKNAYGEHYGVFWDFLSNKPAWSLVGGTDLDQITTDAASQSVGQKFSFLYRKAMVNLRSLPSRLLRRWKRIF